MADQRINALTTSTVSIGDDFFPIDGTTAGTKKLSAFSPSFGGNATVGGTLTVNGTAGITIGGSSGSRLKFTGVSGGWDNGINFVGSGATDRGGFGAFGSSDALTYFYIGPAYNSNWFELRSTGLSIPITTDSTNKDTGCLVLEGGLGVEKNIVAGYGIAARGTLTLPAAWTGNYGIGFESDNGTATSRIFFGDGTGYALKFASRASSTTTDRMTLTDSGALTVGGMIKGAGATYSGNPPTGVSSAFQVDVENATTRDLFSFGDSTRAGLLRGAHDGSGRVQWAFGRYTASAFAEYVRIEGVASTDAKLTVNGTTASTGISSGALVVSGGVGVAGAIVTGGIVRCGGSNGLSLGSDTGNIRIDSAGPAGVEFRGLSSADTITGFTMREMALIDGTTAPSTRAGYATIYVDTADGDLKVKFGDGTVKTIATDT